MRNIAWIFVIIITIFVMGADKPSAVDPVEKEALEVEQMVKDLPVKEQTLKEKEYTGTIDAILEQRIEDVNDVLVFAKDMVTKAKEVCEKMDLMPKNKDFVKTVIDRHGKVEEKEKQKNNNILMHAVVEILNDPNSQPDPADPNYIEESERRMDFLAAVIEICSPK